MERGMRPQLSLLRISYETAAAGLRPNGKLSVYPAAKAALGDGSRHKLEWASHETVPICRWHETAGAYIAPDSRD